MPELKFCRICLDANVRMHQISGSVVQDIYKKIINKKVQEDGSLYYACYICYCQLKNCHQLVKKSEKSEEMLSQIIVNQGKINLKSISLIRKKAFGLLSSMIVATLESLQILDYDDDIKTESQAECDTNEMMVKYEPDDENKSEPPLDYEASEGRVSKQLNDCGVSDGISSGSEDDLPLKRISTGYALDRNVHVNKIGVKTRKGKEQMSIFINLKEKTQDDVESKHNQSCINENTKRDNTSKKDCIKRDLNRKAVRRKEMSNVAKGKSLKTKESRQQIKQTDAHKHKKENTMKLLLNSNGCLFTSYRTKFGCDLCPERFLDIKQLREHTKTHSNDKYIVANVNHLRGRSYKNVDISNLTCNICEQACQDLIDLQTHLTVSHCIQFVGTENFLTPYKLENGLQCILCQQKFNTFLRLSIHMNSHSTNNVCEICGMSYINRSSLRLHVQALHREKKCTLCSSTFHNNSTKMRHMRSVHRLGDYKRYCQLCEKTFRYTYLLVEHRIKEHGAKRTISECVECGKKFSSVCNLKIHIRSVHVRERNFPCSVCDMRFFTKCDQKRHERTHEDVRSFSCSHCEARFKTKDSWRRHLKRQHAQLLPQPIS